jgi:hypothetical protein
LRNNRCHRPFQARWALSRFRDLATNCWTRPLAVVAEERVSADVTIDGHAARRDTVTVIVTTYADENTSQPVRSGIDSVQIDGRVHLPLHVED